MAIASLNKIAERAYGKKNFYPSSMAANDLNEAIVTERMKEFAAEGQIMVGFHPFRSCLQKVSLSGWT